MNRRSEVEIQAIVESAKGGNGDAFGTLYDEFFERIYAYIIVRVRDRHLAEDLTQNTFIKVFEALPQYEPRGVPFAAWIFTVARNIIVDSARAAGRNNHLDVEDFSDELPCPQASSDLGARVSTVQELKFLVEELTEDQQQVIVMRYVGGLNNEEIAAALDKPVGAIKSLKHRALQRLGRLLEKRQVGSQEEARIL